MLAKLRAWRYADAPTTFVRDAVGSDALYIGGTIGLWWFLTPGGRVLEVLDDETSAPVVHEKLGDDAAWILVDAAWHLGVAELLDLLPPAPAAAIACTACSGTHYVQLDAMSRADGDRTVACYACHGRGWRLP